LAATLSALTGMTGVATAVQRATSTARTALAGTPANGSCSKVITSVSVSCPRYCRFSERISARETKITPMSPRRRDFSSANARRTAAAMSARLRAARGSRSSPETRTVRLSRPIGRRPG